ncbi:MULTISPECIES: TonB-dependent siderophore receptor [unclassified Shinella]|uniref:TonB-dependent siderophore receptor n=1 Tax=unclassified Shinella TaxID=2643062 RepID=UPI00225C7277|nr:MULTISPECIES: TonB-dependent siderophore receptor [unclassified Shinella]MCO5140140.1 TonB-dependent siderophore receptor [Shinella sp.]MDC7256842.1 TonB-dependent siderophore receptor [Shinella sp. YE25]CAI0339728.1 TonB-dependent siderophore receptor [Rhizobiaceae bacterium]CAK7258119.1 outer-membrane receptor for ferric coprogen and ferric-rhodotorulic acid [Shinella sp. WSC3-e]
MGKMTATVDARASWRKKGWLATAACCFAVAGAPDIAGAQAKTARSVTAAFDIPAQDLGAALTLFSDRAGLRLLLPSSVVGGKRSSAISGALTREQALDRLLSGTGLTYRFPDARTVTIIDPAATGATESVDDGSTELETITVVGAGNSVTEGTGSYTTGAMGAATKLPLAVHDTPQAVAVVTRQKMDDQAMTTVEDVVRNSTGLSLRKWGGERQRYYSRSFTINNFMLDGLPVNYEPDTFTDGTLSMYDHVEVVRGATGLVTGTGDPSGTMNFVRKRPGDEARTSVTTSIGSWANYRGELDTGGPLNEEGTIRGRFVTGLQDKNSFIRDYENKRQLYYGTLEFDLGESTTLSVGGYYNREDNPGADWNGLGTNPDGTFLDIDRSIRLSPSWAYWDKAGASGFVEIQHEFDNGWTAKIAARALDTTMDMKGTFLQVPTYDAAGNTVYAMRGGAYEYERDQRSFDAYASGPVELFDQEHELAFGASHRTSEIYDVGAAYNTATGGFDLTTIDPHTWDPKSFPIPDILGYWGKWSRTQEVKETSVYGMGRFSLMDDLKLITGARLDWYRYHSTTDDAGWIVDKTFSQNAQFTPYAGLIYDIDDTYSVYASYTSVFKPQSGYTSASGGGLDPVTGTNYEVGAKATFLDERLNIGASLFYTLQENLPESLPSTQCAIGWECYRGVGEVESKGIDFEVSGEILPRWNLMAGYTYTHAQVTKDSNTGAVGDLYNTFLPQHQFKLSTMYHLPDEMDKWRIGGALRWQSKMTSVSLKDTWPALGVTPVVQKPYAVLDFVIGYQVNDTFDLQLNVNNVLDKKYYESIGGFEGPNSFGAPRNFLLTAKATF